MKGSPRKPFKQSLKRLVDVNKQYLFYTLLFFLLFVSFAIRLANSPKSSRPITTNFCWLATLLRSNFVSFFFVPYDTGNKSQHGLQRRQK